MADKNARVREGILTWFDRNQRDLPWRRSRDPYQILVSEVMLQQTQVDRVIPYYEAFLKRFPTVQELACAPASEVIRIWKGLGYNRRAVNLQRTAKVVVDDYDGVFPRDIEQLKALPGIGDYTAGAIACFAFETDTAFLDTNMRRVLERVFLGADPRSGETRQLRDTSNELVPAGDGWRWNQALMEFGALHCTSRKPLCVICPIQRECRAFPAVQSAIRTQSRSSKTAAEESYRGSNRFYRGRIVDALRAHVDDAKGLPLPELGAAVRDDFEPALLPWLDTLVRDLQRDGLAQIAETEATYDASDPTTIRVKLPG